MATDKDYFGEKMRLRGRAQEDANFRQLDRAWIDKMRHQATTQEDKEVHRR